MQNIILDGGRNEGVAGYHPFVLVDNAGVNLQAGAVLQNAENVWRGGGGAISSRLGQVIMYEGAAIKHCKAITGGGVEVNSKGTFQQAMLGMAGGSIEDCEAEDGGGLYVNIGMFQMQGGEISGNRATGEDPEDKETRHGGGGIYIGGAGRTAAVRIQGGKITGNEAYNGGGILLEGRYALLQMEGGTVGGAAAEDGNTARNGGGICRRQAGVTR